MEPAELLNGFVAPGLAALADQFYSPDRRVKELTTESILGGALRRAIDRIYGHQRWDPASCALFLRVLWAPGGRSPIFNWQKCFLFWGEVPLGEVVPEVTKAGDGQSWVVKVRFTFHPATGRSVHEPRQRAHGQQSGAS